MKREKSRYLHEGFTLIELLIVLAIIGALMSIGIPIYSGALESANATVVASNIRTIADGVRMTLSLESTATQDVSDYIQLDQEELNDYGIVIQEDTTQNPPVWKVTVSYSGDMASPGKIEKKLKGCTEATSTSNSVSCVIEIPKF